MSDYGAKDRELEDRKARVLLALHVLIGEKVPALDEDEWLIVQGYREIRDHGYGRVEVVIQNHNMDTIFSTKTMKRKDLSIPKNNT